MSIHGLQNLEKPAGHRERHRAARAVRWWGQVHKFTLIFCTVYLQQEGDLFLHDCTIYVWVFGVSICASEYLYTVYALGSGLHNLLKGRSRPLKSLRILFFNRPPHVICLQEKIMRLARSIATESRA